MSARKVDEVLEVEDRAVEEDPGCVVAGDGLWEDGVGAGGEDENVVGYDGSSGCEDGLVVWAYLGYAGA